MRGLLRSFSGVALLGVLLGHNLAYLFARRAGTAPGIGLNPDGHGYWRYFTLTVLLASALALAVVAARQFRGAHGRKGSELPGYLPLSAGLSGMQLAGFGALELAEYLTSGYSLAEVLGSTTFVSGVLAQIGLGFALALVIRLVARAARYIARLLAGPPQAPPAVPRLRGAAQFVPGRMVGASRGRGPPASLALIP